MKELNDFIRWYKVFLGSKNEITADIFLSLIKKFPEDEQFEIY